MCPRRKLDTAALFAFGAVDFSFLQVFYEFRHPSLTGVGDPSELFETQYASTSDLFGTQDGADGVHSDAANVLS